VDRVSWSQHLAHFGYVNAFIGTPWFQMGDWSLAVEFQDYILIGLTFALYTRKGASWLALIAVVFAG
jgi:peptidoglycan/LPS O-acetylase OafA/YrhL